MAEKESPFLKYQDADGDGLIDACNEELNVLAPPACPDCVPNATAIVPDWTQNDETSPFLNERLCMYQITIPTRHKTTFGDVTTVGELELPESEIEELANQSLEEIFEEYAYTAVENLLKYYDKTTVSGIQKQVYDMLQKTDWSLSIRASSHLKLLYSVPSEEFEALPDAPSDDDDTSIESEVTFATDELLLFSLQVRKALWLYSKNLKVMRKVENSNILFLSDNSVFNLDQYGDWGIGNNASKLAKLITELDVFLNSRKLNMQGAGGFINDITNSNRIVERLTFAFNNNTLERLIIEATGCKEDPIIFTDKLSILKKAGSVWNDKTALNYLINLREMVTDITATEPSPWIDFIVEYTYPGVYVTANSLYDNSDQGRSCLAASLASEAKQLGEDILDPVFTLGDAIAYQFHKQKCAKTPDELQAIKKEMQIYLTPGVRIEGLYTEEEVVAGNTQVYGEVADDRGSGVRGTQENQLNYKLANSGDKIYALAMEQAFGEIETDEEQFSNFCVWLFGLPAGTPGDDPQTSIATAKDYYKNFRGKLNRLKLCGLVDLLSEAIGCLFSSVSLEAALGKMIEAALEGMSVKNLSDLFLGLPADKRAEIDKLAQLKLSQGDLFEDNTTNERAFNEEEGDLTEDDELIREENERIYNAIVNNSNQLMGSSTYEPFVAAVQNSLVTVAAEDTQNTAEKDWISSHEGNTGGLSYSSWTSWKDQNRSTLAPSYFAELDSITGGLHPNKIVTAYIKAIIEVYVGEELVLVDLIGKFPGAPIISNIIAGMTCPGVPYFNPSTIDYLKDWNLPICRNNKDITWPILMVPPRHKFTDLWLFLKNAAKLAIAELYQKILVSLMVKLCKNISDRSCKALGIAGELALQVASGENTLINTIRDSICGDQVDDITLLNTVTDLFEAFGNGSAAFSDTDTLTDFAMDISSAVTQDEMSEAFLGEASEEFTSVVIELCNNEYQQYKDAFSDAETIKKAFGNMGNVMPVDFRENLRSQLGGPGADLPSNPTLCATDEQIEQFCENRAALLEGRASPSQIRQLCDNFQDSILDDLGDLAPIMNDFPGYVQNNMPPLISDPGCDNGILPYEPELVADAVAASLGAELEQLKISYVDDMIGDGPGRKNWGFLNMVLSDTMGQPLTTHHRKTNEQEKRVDFYKNWTWQELQPELKEVFEAALVTVGSFVANPVVGIMSLVPLINSLPRPIEDQRGAFPMYVADWLRKQMTEMSFSYAINNSLPSSHTNEYYQTSITDLPGYRFYNNRKINYLSLPDIGYNVQIDPYFYDESLSDGMLSSTGYVEFIKLARKNFPDLTLQFRDNAKGIEDYEFAYGFDLEIYFSDIAPTASGSLTPKSCMPGKVSNRGNMVYLEEDNINSVVVSPSDSTRIKIYNMLNPYADLSNDELNLIEDPSVKKDIKKDRYDGGTTLKERSFEFMSIDNTFDNIYFDEYPRFLETFTVYQEKSPMLVLLEEILSNAGHDDLSDNDIKQFQNDALAILSEHVNKKIYENESMWLYGATYDHLSMRDAEYVIPDNTPNVAEEYWGGPYQEAKITIPAEDETETTLPRELQDDDMILGVSRMQYEIEKGDFALRYVSDNPTDYDSAVTQPAENRVFYLDPAIYGGTYMNPPVYIKPMSNKGWYGMIDFLFPELSVCKSSTTDFIDFQDLQDQIDNTYRFLEDDSRLSQDPECRVEVPFNRMMERSSKAFMYGLVDAAIRIYCSAHIIKALPVFSVFAPKFSDNFSAINSAYIVETMEKSFMDAQGGFFEFFTAFKDQEFWYAFLEQSVEAFAYKVENDLIEPSSNAESALTRLNKVQEEFEFATKEDLKQAKDEQRERRTKLLRNYRADKNLEAVQQHQEDCKIILQELIVEQVNILGQKVINNFKGSDMEPQIKNMDYYVFDNFTAGASLTLNETVNFDGSFETSYPDFPEVPFEENDEADEPYYTDGGQFVVGEKYSEIGPGVGEEYIGYYHVHIDEETEQLKFMAGEYHSIEAHDVLTPVINLVKVPIGDVPEYGDRSIEATTESIDQPFLIEKYITINGSRYKPTEAVDIIKSNDNSLLISDVYPGTLEINETASGLTGELGVRYGLSFSLLFSGEWYEVTSVEVDALDRLISQFSTLSSDSALLLCLLNHLKNDTVFKLITNYILPVRKITSIMSLYVDLGLLPSIGELTVADGASWEKGLGLLSDFDSSGKPGLYAKTETEEVDGETFIKSITIDGNPGWASQEDRNVWSPLFLEFDSWDQELMKNSKSKIKRLFKGAYNDRDFKIDKINDTNIVNLHTERLKEAIKLPSGDRILPRFRRKRLRSNPFNDLGIPCESEENEE